MRSLNLRTRHYGPRRTRTLRGIKQAGSSFIIPRSYRTFSATRVRGPDGGERKWSTPLAKQLSDAINITGPIPLTSYMRMCLTSDTGGYYTGAIDQERDQFGRRGDFITSPEISQVFGELIGIWFIAEWISQGRPSSGVQLIEVGPGRGTLMDDVLRTIRNFKDMASAVQVVYLVEASRHLRLAQKRLLCGVDAPLTESKGGHQSTSKYMNLPIVWTETIQAVPRETDKTPFIMAHEFFDALPIHAFQRVDVPSSTQPGSPTSSQTSGPQWREMVVTPAPPASTHASLRTPKAEQSGLVPEFQLTLSPSPTRHSVYVPESSARYRALKSVPDALIEVCPDASLYAADFAVRIGGSAQQKQQPQPRRRPSGAALILDYGPSDTVPVNSLRGIRQHRRVSPFSEPGLVDLSADVDFIALAEAATQASDGVEVHGPVAQADFLEAMGIRQRVEMLTGKETTTTMTAAAEAAAAEAAAAAAGEDDRKRNIEAAWKRLVDRGPDGMGKLYKALAIIPENGGRRRPVGFGGDVGN